MALYETPNWLNFTCQWYILINVVDDARIAKAMQEGGGARGRGVKREGCQEGGVSRGRRCQEGRGVHVLCPSRRTT